MENGATSGRFGTREECPVCTDGKKNGKLCILHDPKEQPLNDKEIEEFWQKAKDAINPQYRQKLKSVTFPKFTISKKNISDASRIMSAFEKTDLFEDCVFQEASFFGFTFKNSLQFKNCTFNKNVDFISIDFDNKVDFYDCIFEKRIAFRDSLFNNRLQIGGAKNQSRAKTLVFRELRNATEINIFGMEIKNLIFSQAENEYGIHINNVHISKGGRFCILDANMTKSTFGDIDLNQAKIKLKRTNFLGALFSAVKWPDKINVDRAMFNHLKHVYDQNENYLEANRFMPKS